MLAVMPSRPKKGSGESAKPSGSRGAGKKDVFARLDEDVVDKLDEIVEGIRPKTTRSSLIAGLVEQYVEQEYPKVLARRRSQEG